MYNLAKKIGKGQQKWNKAYVESGLDLKKSNAPMKTKYLFNLIYCCNEKDMCYNFYNEFQFNNKL